MEVKVDIEGLLKNETEQVAKLHKLVEDSIKKQNILSTHLYQKAEDSSTFGEKIADKVADFGGSWAFIISFFSALMGWIVLNTWILVQKPFDPYPYILLNLVLSCLAAIQAPVIMMSQNRKEDKDRKRAESDYLVNLKAEIEIRNLHQKLDMLMMEQMKSLLEIQQEQLNLLNELKVKP